MTSEPGESPLFSVVSGHPDAEDLAALTAVLAARLAARQRAAARAGRCPRGPVSLAGPGGADPGPAAPVPAPGAGAWRSAAADLGPAPERRRLRDSDRLAS